MSGRGAVGEGGAEGEVGARGEGEGQWEKEIISSRFPAELGAQGRVDPTALRSPRVGGLTS